MMDVFEPARPVDRRGDSKKEERMHSESIGRPATGEVLGAQGLVLPGLLHIRPSLTPVAAAGLVVLMVGAAMFTPPDQLALVLLPVVVGLLAALVAYGRSKVVPL
jgi:hypothetical protein